MAYTQTILSPTPNHLLSTGNAVQSPTIAQRRPNSKHRFIADLSQCLFDFVVQLLPTTEELAVKEDVRKLLERLIRTIEPESRLLSFGSTANGFSLRNSDMDLCCLIDSEERLAASDLVTMLGDLLERETKFHVKPLPHARIPIVKLSLDPSPGLPLGIACDIGFENRLALENTRLLMCYAMIDPSRIRTLVLFLKVWSKRRKINSPYKGTLSSYGYVLLVIYFLVHVKNPPVLPNLQQMPPLRPISPEDTHLNGHNIWFFDDVELLRQRWHSENTDTVAELLVDFFRYYSRDFSYNTGVASIRAGLLKKESKGWQNDLSSSRYNDARERNRLCIEDPFEIDFNVARCVTKDGLYTIRGEFMRASRILASRPERAILAIAELCAERPDEHLVSPPPHHRPSTFSQTSKAATLSSPPSQTGTNAANPSDSPSISKPAKLPSLDNQAKITNSPKSARLPPISSLPHIPPQTPYTVGSNSLRPAHDSLSPPAQFFDRARDHTSLQLAATQLAKEAGAEELQSNQMNVMGSPLSNSDTSTLVEGSVSADSSVASIDAQSIPAAKEKDPRVLSTAALSIVPPQAPPEHMAPKRSKWTSPPPAEAPTADHSLFESQLGMGLELATAATPAREQEAKRRAKANAASSTVDLTADLETGSVCSSSASEVFTDDEERERQLELEMEMDARSDDVTSVRSFTEGTIDRSYGNIGDISDDQEFFEGPSSPSGLSGPRSFVEGSTAMYRRPSWHVPDTAFRIPQPQALGPMQVPAFRSPEIPPRHGYGLVWTGYGYAYLPRDNARFAGSPKARLSRSVASDHRQRPLDASPRTSNFPMNGESSKSPGNGGEAPIRDGQLQPVSAAKAETARRLSPSEATLTAAGSRSPSRLSPIPGADAQSPSPQFRGGTPLAIATPLPPSPDPSGYGSPTAMAHHLHPTRGENSRSPGLRLSPVHGGVPAHTSLRPKFVNSSPGPSYRTGQSRSPSTSASSSPRLNVGFNPAMRYPHHHESHLYGVDPYASGEPSTIFYQTPITRSPRLVVPAQRSPTVESPSSSAGYSSPGAGSPSHGSLNSSFTWPSPKPMMGMSTSPSAPALTQPSPLSSSSHVSFLPHANSEHEDGPASRDGAGADVPDHLTREGRMTLDERITRMEYANRIAAAPRDIFPTNHPPSLTRMGPRLGGSIKEASEGPGGALDVENIESRGRESRLRRDRASETDSLMGSATHTPTPTSVAQGHGLVRPTLQSMYSPSHGHSHSTATITGRTPPPSAIDTSESQAPSSRSPRHDKGFPASSSNSNSPLHPQPLKARPLPLGSLGVAQISTPPGSGSPSPMLTGSHASRSPSPSPIESEATTPPMGLGSEVVGAALCVGRKEEGDGAQGKGDGVNGKGGGPEVKLTVVESGETGGEVGIFGGR